MISKEKTKKLPLDVEISNLRERIDYLEKIRSDNDKQTVTNTQPHLNPLSFAIEESLPKKNFLPTTFFFAVSSMLLLGGYNILLIVLFSITSFPLFALLNALFAGVIVGTLAFFDKQKIEEFRLAAKKELIKNEETEGKIREAQQLLEQQVERRTTQVWETNSFLKKEIIRRRKAEEGVKNYNYELLSHKKILETKNNELNSLNSELKNSEKDLRELNESKDKFFSILAHDLRSPFASIIGLADFLNAEIQNLNTDEIKKIVRSISQSSKRVNMLLENLLKWSLVQTGRLQVDPVPFNISSVITDVVELLSPTSENKEIKLEKEFGHNTLVYADKNMVETIIRNLLSNAIKFSNPSGKIIIRTIQQNQFTRVDIIDNGIGIHEEDFRKIFKIDEHTNVVGTGNEKGTGLGLILCKEFVERNGGKIWFESTINEGSTFYFTIPIISENERALFDTITK
jgi:signal transduction histidine kinase